MDFSEGFEGKRAFIYLFIYLSIYLLGLSLNIKHFRLL